MPSLLLGHSRSRYELVDKAGWTDKALIKRVRLRDYRRVGRMVVAQASLNCRSEAYHCRHIEESVSKAMVPKVKIGVKVVAYHLLALGR